MEEVTSLAHLEGLNAERREKPKRQYYMHLWDMTQDRAPLWTSELMFWSPYDLCKPKTTASLTLLAGLREAAKKGKEIRTLTVCIGRSSNGHHAHPIVRGYYQYFLDDFAALVEEAKKCAEKKEENTKQNATKSKQKNKTAS